jgi:hypothetical protein
MKLEQNMMEFNETSGSTGYIDLARALSAVNGKSIAQTKRSKGKYKPLGFLIRIRALSGAVGVTTLSCAYPTRNAVVLAGHARDEMLKSAGISRSNLESYQKELRLKFDKDMDAAGTYFPGATDKGTGSGGWGAGLTYDYTKVVFDDPGAAGTDITQTLCVLGTQSEDISADNFLAVVDNWYKWRHSFTPAAGDDDIADNVFSYVIQQSSTSDQIINMIDDSQDEKPYNLTEFSTLGHENAVGIGVGNPTSPVICAPLGLLKIDASAGTAAWQIEVVGVVEL